MKRNFYRLISVFVIAAVLCVNLFSPVSYAASGVFEIAFDNMFVFEHWANNTRSGIVSAGLSGGTITKDILSGSFTMTNSSTSEIYTGHSMDPNPAGNTTFYSMKVEPNTDYVFSYNVTGSVTSFESFVFVFDDTGAFSTLYQHSAMNYGVVTWTFTTPSNADNIQIRFDVNVPGESATVKDIRICKSEVYAYASSIQTRNAYNYSASGVYGTLPTLQRDNLVFAGWFTGENGTGERIASDTALKAGSMSVYSKWEPVTSSISIISVPGKQNYCVGDKLKTTGLAVAVSYPDGSTQILESGFVCTPMVLTKAGTQTVTVSYGGNTAEFTVNVKEYADKTVIVNNKEYALQVRNNVYTFNCTAESFNRFELTYYSDAYVKGTIVMGSVSEGFFLEPSMNGSFAAFIDGFLGGTTQTAITSISFEPLDKDEMEFSLLSVKTIKSDVPGNMLYLTGTDYKIGVNLNWGGALTYLEDLSNGVMSSVRKYSSSATTEVDFSSKVSTSALYNTSKNVNLINCHDTGRLVQQSYYGTGSAPYEPGIYQDVNWPYNPVQGGNLYNEASKIVDYKITQNEIYIKCRPLDWAKQAEYITPSYMEAWYTLENGRMKATCRFVDYSGYPSTTTTQEFPAFYCVEPLNNFIYYSGGTAWSANNSKNTVTDLEFWANATDQNFHCNENWAAFIGADADSFGIGIYAPGQTEFYVGVYERGTSKTVDPATENATSYIGVVDTINFKSYNPTSYVYYLTTGNIDDIRNNFRLLGQSETDDCDVGYTNGFCNMCSRYEEPVLSTDKYDLNGDNAFDSVYEIGNAGQLYWFASSVNSGNTNINAILTADITVNKNVLINGTLSSNVSSFRAWTPIGNASNKYNGIFSGNGKTVSGLYYNSTSTDYAGLFGYIGSDARVSMVGVEESYFAASSYIGGIAGRCDGQVNVSYSSASINGSSYVGGLFGLLDGSASDCYFSGTVSSGSSVGALCGSISSGGSVDNCYYDNTKCSGNAYGSNSGTVQSASGLATFADGEAAYLLNHGITDGTQVFYQTLGIDSLPKYDGETVYCGYESCTSEQVSYSNTALLEKAGHSGGKATCSAPAVCDICGESYGDKEPQNHVGGTQIRDAVEATETNDGYTGDIYCLGCDKKLADGEIIPATGIQDPSRYVFADNGALLNHTSRYIYGLTAGVDSLDGYVYFSDEACSINYELTPNGFGTGVKAVMLYDGNAFAEYTVIIFGDVNGDGWYDGNDAFVLSLIINGMLGKADVGEAVWLAADCNHDGEINEADYELLISAGLLLEDVDQNKSVEELMLNAGYIEYASVINQSADINITPDINTDENISDNQIVTIDFEVIFTALITFIKQVVSLVLSVFID
ncbi:MAG: bacterial Ig-like domain-containing protein [Clostridia bacterium]|nr:bacterial Ig-like domain-containing protein [Clostridia bacterium]